MIQRTFVENYEGHELKVIATTRTGSLATPTGTVQLNTMVFFLDGDEVITDTYVQNNMIKATFAAGMDDMRGRVDGKDEAELIFDELEFSEDGTLATPTGFSLSQPGGAGTDLVFTFNQIGNIVYELQHGTAADFSSSLSYASGLSSPYNLTVAPGMRYARLRATKAGLTSSDWALASYSVS